MVKNDLKMTLWEGLFFPEIVFFLKKKESTATQEEQGSKKGPFLQIHKKIYFFDVDRWIRVEKLVWLIKFSLRVDGTEALSWKDLGFEPRDLGFVAGSKKWPKKIVEKYVSQKCPKSISLDSGHLD